MSRTYDNWERLVAAVLKKEELWQLFHEQSRSPSMSSESSSGFSFNLTSSSDDIPISFPSPGFSASIQNGDDFGSKVAANSSSNIIAEDQSPVKNVSSTRSRRRDLKIEVPNLRVLDQGAFSHAPDSSENRPNITPISRAHPKSNWPDSSKQQSYPLPLPPGSNSNSSPVSRQSSAATSPSASPHSPVRAENGTITSPVSPWKKGKFLSSGAFGNVYIGFNSETGEMCAMKEVTFFGVDGKSKQSATQLGKQLEREIALLSSLKHPNLVHYYGSETLGDNFYIYMEYVSGIYGNLQQYGRLGESAIRSYTQQILSGLAYLHSKSIAHRDIKGANILVDPNGSVKLANFGIAKHIAEQSDPSLLPASHYWMAPEVIMNSNVHNRAVDIWSLGWTLLEMATSKPPLSQYEWMVSMFKAGNHEDLLTIIPDHLSDECKDFVRRCLRWNPVHRATASQLLSHPFVKNAVPLQKPPPLEKQTSASKLTPRPTSTNTDIHHGRSVHQLVRGRVTVRSAPPSNYVDIYTLRYISAPFSPVGSPLRRPRSPQHLNDRRSPPHISSTRGIGAIPYHHLNDLSPNAPNQRPIITSPSYWDPNILRGLHSKSHPSQKLPSRENDTRGKQLGSTANEQLVFADRVSKKLLNSSSRLPSHRMANV